MATRELESGVRHDSLFLGISFGMTPEEFFAHCWELNKKGMMRQSNQNNAVYHEIDSTTTRKRMAMEFYPTFKEGDGIVEMPVIFKYVGWAPWNKDLDRDKLLLDTKNLIEKWYGPGFIPFGEEKNLDAWVRVDGNRRVLVLPRDETTVKVTMTDLTADISQELRDNARLK